jgi:hypothetical protein
MSNKIYTYAELRELELQYAKSLDLSVKNVKTFPGHDSMVGVDADIYYKNKKFAHFYDNAYGGEPEVSAVGNYDDGSLAQNNQILKDLMSRASTLPKVKYQLKGIDRTSTNTFWLHTLVDTLINAELERKELNKIAKKGIVYVDPKDNETYTWGWNHPLPKLFKLYPTKALPSVQKRYNQLVEEGCIVKNTDLLAEYGVKL